MPDNLLNYLDVVANVATAVSFPFLLSEYIKSHLIWMSIRNKTCSGCLSDKEGRKDGFVKLEMSLSGKGITLYDPGLWIEFPQCGGGTVRYELSALDYDGTDSENIVAEIPRGMEVKYAFKSYKLYQHVVRPVYLDHTLKSLLKSQSKHVQIIITSRGFVVSRRQFVSSATFLWKIWNVFVRPLNAVLNWLLVPMQLSRVLTDDFVWDRFVYDVRCEIGRTMKTMQNQKDYHPNIEPVSSAME